MSPRYVPRVLGDSVMSWKGSVRRVNKCQLATKGQTGGYVRIPRTPDYHEDVKAWLTGGEASRQDGHMWSLIEFACRVLLQISWERARRQDRSTYTVLGREE